MNYNDWQINIDKGTAQHESGYLVRFRGEPDRDNFGPIFVSASDHLRPSQREMLLEHGIAAYREAYASNQRADALAEA